MKKQGILKIFAGMMLIATTTACGSSSAGVKNVDLKDPDGDYHVQVDFKTNEVTLSCDVENDDTGTGEGWSEILKACNREQDSAINFETMSFNTTYKMSDDFKKVFKDFWENDFQNELFEGSKYLLLLADKIDEIKTICQFCSKKATMVLRTENGKPVYEGNQIQIGGNETYIPVCRKHYFNPMISKEK